MKIFFLYHPDLGFANDMAGLQLYGKRYAKLGLEGVHWTQRTAGQHHTANNIPNVRECLGGKQ